ncbi:MAG: hypothetical protein KA419_13875 [Acidobacteria bacterium]|nr:hypothetical protein [Acidobacteriota bacterium]
MYDTLVLIDPETTITADDIERQLKDFCRDPGSRNAQMIRKGEGFILKWPGYALEVTLNTGRSVLVESDDIANRFAVAHPHRQRISQCSVRVEISGDDDPEMSFFNDFCIVLDSIERLGTVYTFDPGNAQFMNG